MKLLMRAHGIQGAKRRGKRWRTTTPDPAASRPPDLAGWIALGLAGSVAIFGALGVRLFERRAVD